MAEVERDGQLSIPPDGWAWEWGDVDPARWRLVDDGDARGCRANAGRHSRACGKPVVAEINRGLRRASGRFDCWWAYCPDHIYGRRIDDGRLVELHLVEVAS